MHEFTEESLPPMVALVRDPSTIFAYWEVDPQLRADTLEGTDADAARWVLRLTNQELGAQTEIPIDIDARNWYVTVMAGHTYLVELGVVDSSGAYHCVESCGPLHMPPLSYSTVYDTQWMIKEDDFRQLLRIAGTGMPGSSGQQTGFSLDQASTWVTVVEELPGTEAFDPDAQADAS